MASGLATIGKKRELERIQVKSQKKASGLATIAARANERKNRGGVLGGIGYAGANLGLGLASVGEGVLDIATAAGDLLQGDTDMAKYRFLDNQTSKARQKLERDYNPGMIMRGVGDVASGIGNSLTFMIPYVGPYLAGAGYAGMGVSGAAEKTGDVGLKELGYGAVSGGMEFALDALTGGAGKAAKNIGASITRKLGREAAQAGAKATGKLAGKSFGKSVLVESLKGAGGEALEESLSELIDPQLQKLFGIDKNAETSLKNVAYAGLIGAISGGLMTAGPAAINYKTSASVGKTIRESGETKDFLDYTRRVLDASTRTQERYAEKAEASKTPADAGKLKKTVDFLNLNSATRKSKRAEKRVENMAETVRRNLDTYEGYLQKADKTPKELEISDAVLGELRGNVFLLENATAIELYEDTVLELEDDDKQELVDEINTDAKRMGLKRSDYTVTDLNDNVDDILTTVAIKYMMPEKYGINLFEESRDNARANAKKSEAAENTAQTVQETAQGAQEVKAGQQTAEAAKPVQGRYKGAGAVRIAGGKQVKELGLSDEQYVAYKAAEILAPTTGADIEIHESMDKDGKTANGYYDPATNTIHININAKRGTSGKQIALYTLGHETTHYIREWSPEKYDELASFVMDKLGGDTDSLVSSKADFLRTISDYKNKTDEEIMDLAREEVIADGMELILTDGKVLDELARTDRSLWQKVKAWIENTISKIRKAYADLNQASKTAQTLKETLDSLEEVERLFTEGVKEAGERAGATTGGVVKYSSEESIDADLLDFYYSVMSMEDKNAIAKRKKNLGKISEKHAQIVSETIKKETGKDVNVSGYQLWIDGSAIRHIDEKHGKNGSSDHSMQNPKDVARIEWAANYAESGRIARKQNGELDYSTQYRNRDGSPSPKVILEKSIGDGKLIVAECVPDTSGKKIHVISARIEKGDKGQVLNIESYDSPQPTSKTPLGGDVTIDSIPQNSNSVNRKFSISEETPQATDTNDGRKDAKSADVSEYPLDATDDTDGGRTEDAEGGLEREIERLEVENQKQSEEIRKLQFERFRRAVKDGQIEANTQRKALSKGADAVLDAIGVTDGRNRRELLRRMTELYASMSAEDGITYEQAFDKAGEIADWLISRQPDVINAEMAEQAAEIIQTIHGAKVRLTGTQALEAATVYGSADAYRKAMFGRITVTQNKEGTPLDVQWSEWADQYPDIFDSDTKEADMPLRLAEAYENLVAMRDNVEPVETYINPDMLAATIFTQVGEIGYTSEAGVFNDRTVLADMLLEVAENEQDYKIAKRYKAKAGELAEAEKRQADLRRKIAEVNREINDLQGRVTNVKKTKRQPWVMDALQDAVKRKGQLIDEIDTITETIRKEDDRLLSIRNAAPFRRAVAEANKRANAAERKAERAEKNTQKVKDEYEQREKISSDTSEITLRVLTVRKILGQLNTMLYHPNRQKHVPEALRGLTEAVLKSADPKEFQKNRSNIRAMAELASKIAKLDSKVAKTAAEQETLDAMKSKYEHLEAETISTYKQAKALLTAFEQYQKDTLGEAGFDKETIDNMADLVEQIKEVPMTEMTLESLKAVETFYTMILHQVNSANQTFATEKALNIDELGQKASQEAQESKALKFFSPKGREWVGMASVRKFFLQNMKPLTVFEAIGSNQFKELFQRVLDGEETWATDILDARKKILDARERYKYKDWELNERKAVKTKDGRVNLSLAERMALYAYSFRDQAKSHLEGGGFVLDPNATEQVKVGRLTTEILEKRLNNQKRYTMDEFMMGELAETLSDEQKAYVKEMQQYLTDMGKKGNEVSKKLYGMDIFTEEHYFPIKVKSEYLASQTGKTGDPNIKNRGMTKEVVPEAKDPLVLQGFDEIMVDHINSMATYHSFVLPIEDLTRVLNYKPVNYLRDEDGNVVLDKNGKPKVDEEANKQYDTLKSVISSKYGDEVNRYIVQLIRDLNGGARRDAAAGIIDKGITQFKRASTMASLSVLIQQPTSIVRAAAYIEPKYLLNTAGINVKNHKELWERVKKYAPVAIIKEMGGYDTGVGARTADYLNAATYEKGEKLHGFLTDSDYRAEVFGFGAAYADELAWIQMFEACVNEQADKLRKSRDSEEVLKAAGERFTEIVRHTQVYDSTLTRSENMRSKDTGMKMATAFMAEPTTVVSMVAEAIIKGERGDTKFLRNTAGAVIGSILLNSLLSSLVYAMRDDDEDKTYEEKYISTLAMEMAEGVNPAEYFPVFRDIMSLVKGYEIERSDMALIGDLINSIRRMSSSTQSVSQKLTNTGSAVAAFFGLPVTNIMRDVKGIQYTFLHQTDTEQFTKTGLSVAMKEQFDTMWNLWNEETTNAYQLYQSAIDHDAKHFARVAARYESTEDVEQALRKALREYDPRINEAAEARLNGELEVYEDLLSQIEKEGNFDRNMLIRAVNNQMIYIKDHMEDETVPKADEEEEDAPEALYKTSDLNAALERGDGKDYADIYDYLMEIKQEDGKTEAQARSAVKSSITSYWKKRYLEAWEANDTSEIKRIQAILVGTKLYGNRNDVAKMGEGWVKAYAETKLK